jgi:hypothetical protein
MRSAVLASAMLFSAGCPGPQTIPDPSIPHQVAEEAEIEVWCNTPKGLARCEVRLLEGWWVASPQVVEP